MDERGFIVAQCLTESGVDDASVVPKLLEKIPSDRKIVRFTADGAYDKNAIYKTFDGLGARVVVPPVKTDHSFETQNARGEPETQRSIGESWSASVEERDLLPTTSARRKHLLSIQTNRWKPTSVTPPRPTD